MGKKSRLKKMRQDGQLAPKIEKEQEIQESGLARFFIFVIKYGVYLTLATPLLVSGEFFFPFVGLKSLYFMGLAELIIFAFLALQIVSKNYRPKINLLSLALGVLLLVIILAGVFGVNPSYSFWSKFERMTGILMWLHLVGFFLVVSVVFKKRGDWRKLFYVSLVVACLISIIAVGDLGSSTRGGGTIGNSSFLGAYLLFNFFFALYLGVRDFSFKKWFFHLPFFVLAGFFLFTVYWLSARAATLAMAGGLVLAILFFFAFASKQKFLRVSGKVLLVLCFIGILLSALMVFQEGSFVREKFIEQATKSRLVVWEKAWLGFKEKPVLGWGPENFEYVFTRHFNPCMFLSECGGEIWFDRAHNIIFDTLVTTGILGMLAYAFVLLACFWLLWKSYLKKKIGFLDCLLPTVVLIAYSVQNLTVFDMISSYLMFFLVLGFIGAKTSDVEVVAEKNKFFKPSTKQKAIFTFLSFGLFFALLFFVIQPLRQDRMVIKSLKEEEPEKRLEFYEKSFSLSPLGKFQIKEFLADRSYNIIEGALVGRKPDEQIRTDLVQQELDLMVNALQNNIAEAPLDFRSVFRLAQILNLYSTIDSSQSEQAMVAIEQAIELSPTNQQIYWVLAQYWLYQRNLDEARAAAEKAIALEERLYRSWAIAVQLERFAGSSEQAEDLINRAIEVNPNWQEDLQKVFEGANQ